MASAQRQFSNQKQMKNNFGGHEKEILCQGGPQSKNKRKQKKKKILSPCERIKKKLWNMWVTVIPIVVGALGIVLKGLKSGL